MIYEKIIAFVAEQFAVDADTLSRDTDFISDLGADSLDIVELTMTLEEEFSMSEVPEDALAEMHTIGDLADYVEKAVS